MWVLTAAFLIAAMFMFVHPSVTIILVWAGLCLLVVAFVVHAMYRRAERAAARSALQAHACPSCGEPVQRTDPAGEWTCAASGASFAGDGEEPAPAAL
jgi:hypothetical protein